MKPIGYRAKREVDWWRYETCIACKQAPGAPCRDLRFGIHRLYFNDRPHVGRRRVS